MVERAVRDRYRLVVELNQADKSELTERLLQVQRRSGATGGDRPMVRLTETDGTAARRLWMRSARDDKSRLAIAVANLSDDPRAIRIAGADSLRTAMDVVSNESLAPHREPITLAPWQIRLLLAYD